MLQKVRLRARWATFVVFRESRRLHQHGDKPQPFNGYYFQILTKQGDKAQGGAKDYIVDGKIRRVDLEFSPIPQNTGIRES